MQKGNKNVKKEFCFIISGFFHLYGLENQKREKSSRFSIFMQPSKMLV